MIVKQTTLTVTENTRLADGIYRLRLAGDTSAITAPGQFVNLKLSGFFLRRPISVCDWSDGELTLIYKVLGHGTEAMTGMAVGTELDALTGLGNGFDMSRGGEHPLLVGGGVGIPPLYGLAKRLHGQGRDSASKLCRVLALLLPALLHGCYDFIASIESVHYGWLFAAFVAILFVLAFILVRRQARHDRYINNYDAEYL